MEDEKKTAQEEPDFSFGEDAAGTGGGFGKIILILILVIGAGAAAAWFGYRYLTANEDRERIANLKKGLFSPDEIQQAMMEQLKRGDEFTALRFMEVDAPGSADGKRSVADVYQEILDYAPENIKHLEDGLEKFYYLNIQRAEKAMRAKNYKQAIAYYNKAKKIKPGGPEIAPGLTLAKKKFSLKKKKGPLPRRRSYESVYETVQSKLSLVKYLYDKELRITPGIKGKINVEFTVKPDGSVVKETIVSSTVNSERLQNALLKHIKMWEFGEVDRTAGNLTMSYPFVFY